VAEHVRVEAGQPHRGCGREGAQLYISRPVGWGGDRVQPHRPEGSSQAL
jgi:hypothetical protein